LSGSGCLLCARSGHQLTNKLGPYYQLHRRIAAAGLPILGCTELRRALLRPKVDADHSKAPFEIIDALHKVPCGKTKTELLRSLKRKCRSVLLVTSVAKEVGLTAVKSGRVVKSLYVGMRRRSL